MVNEEIYQVALEHIDEVVYKILATREQMTNGVVQFVSGRVRSLLGYEPQDFVDDPSLWFQSLHPDDVAGMLETTRDIFETRRASTRLYRLRHAVTLEYRWFEDRVVPQLDEQGHVVAYVGVARDVTDRVRVEERLRQSQKLEAVGRLAGGVAHDFNNMLTVIIGCADLLLNERNPDDPTRVELLQIIEAADRAAALTQQLLAFGRRQMLVPSVISLISVAEEMAPILKRLIHERIEIIVKSEPSVWRVRADRSQMEQIILNLVLNARDAMPTGGELTISTENVRLNQPTADAVGHPPGDYVRLMVEDTGAGMDAETKAHIFEPFFTTKDVGQGTGLGLSTVYGIVEQSGGWILVDSEAGKGSTFSVYFPRVESDSGGYRPFDDAQGRPERAEGRL